MPMHNADVSAITSTGKSMKKCIATHEESIAIHGVNQ